MKLILISDTHTYYPQMNLPPCDILLHAGDFTFDGAPRDVQGFNTWLGVQPARYRVVIAGNHDLCFDRADKKGGYYYGFKQQLGVEPESLLTNAIYLNDSGCEIEGLKIWGSPIQPWFYEWAFNRIRGEEIDKHWALISADTNILITHGPPYGILDRPYGKEQPVGCEMLTWRLPQYVNLKLHLFGHIHGDYGHVRREFDGRSVLFVNASFLDEMYKPNHKPLMVDTETWEITEIE
jgi:predicted phosphodiesterase